MAPPDLVELLANLDFLVGGPKTKSLQDHDFNEYREKIIAQLADSLWNKYTVNQIKRQLWQEFQTGYDYPKHSFDLLFLHGSTVLWNLNRESRRLIKEQLKAIQLRKALGTPRCRRLQSIVSAPVVKRKEYPRSASTRPFTDSSAERRCTSAIQKGQSFKQKRLFKVKIPLTLTKDSY
jgi:hypothetical protein